ncbi:MAG: hypothetical protein Q9182_004725 [Xanthomendoza sp. 2 TL-2023]
MASVGALMIIGGLAIDPLSQQLVHYIQQEVPDDLGTATIPVASTWTGSTQDTSVLIRGEPTPPLPMKGAIQTGLFSQNSLISDLTPICSSGNCTFPNYRSLAICAQSADVTYALHPRGVTVKDPDFPGQGKVTKQEWYLSQSNFIRGDAQRLLNMSSVAPPDRRKSTDSDQDRSLDFSGSIVFKDSALPVADRKVIPRLLEAGWRFKRIRLDDNIKNRHASIPIRGTANTTQIIVQVQWGWIAVLAVLVAGSVFFLPATIIASSGRQKSVVWKSSTLPLLKALDRELHTDGFEGMRTVSATEDWAQGVPVLLARDGEAESWKLVQRDRDDDVDGEELRPLK